ncbi:MAG TPA: hypothetical protein DCL01_12625 [Thauera sp.]|nr:hypothetical protein [Thauera sp.]HHW62450.1 hypothetical protein [Rhodocyclaceae bacterium]
MPRFAQGLPYQCRDCRNRTKPVRRGVAWCLVENAPVPFGFQTDCASFVERDGTPLADAPAIYPGKSKG